MNRQTIGTIVLALTTLLTSNFAQAQCSGGGMYDPQGGVCHQAGGGYTVPNSIQGGSSVVTDPWGALAVDIVNRSTSGRGINYKSQADAESAAIKSCNDKNCRVIASYKESCGAVASDRNGVITAGVDVDPNLAEQKAIAACRNRSQKSCVLWIKARCAGSQYRVYNPTEKQ